MLLVRQLAQCGAGGRVGAQRGVGALGESHLAVRGPPGARGVGVAELGAAGEERVEFAFADARAIAYSSGGAHGKVASCCLLSFLNEQPGPDVGQFHGREDPSFSRPPGRHTDLQVASSLTVGQACEHESRAIARVPLHLRALVTDVWAAMPSAGSPVALMVLVNRVRENSELRSSLSSGIGACPNLWRRRAQAQAIDEGDALRGTSRLAGGAALVDRGGISDAAP